MTEGQRQNALERRYERLVGTKLGLIALGGLVICMGTMELLGWFA